MSRRVRAQTVRISQSLRLYRRLIRSQASSFTKKSTEKDMKTSHANWGIAHGVLSLVAVILVLVVMQWRTNQAGFLVGKVLKLSYKGPAAQMWEGELTEVGLDGYHVEAWRFSVTDGRIVRKLQEAHAKALVVNITYNKQVWLNPATHKTTYRITGVTVANDNN